MDDTLSWVGSHQLNEAPIDMPLCNDEQYLELI